jgi:hypothetical protein
LSWEIVSLTACIKTGKHYSLKDCFRNFPLNRRFQSQINKERATFLTRPG